MDYTDAIFIAAATQDGELSPVITGGQPSSTAPATQDSTSASTTVPAGGGTEAEPEVGFWGQMAPTILMMVAIYAALYFLFLRPQRKQAKQQKTMQSNIRPGDNVVTQSGLYGKVMDVGEDVFIVEFGTNRGVRIPVAKSEIAGIKAPKMTPAPIPPKE
jgi:preprotein translocase subunit YajC